jgi:hypothetical protein
MQGSGLSSASIWTVYDTECTASTRQPVYDLKVAWTRVKDTSLDYAIVGTSIVGGTDIIDGQPATITAMDYFYYYDEAQRTVMLTYERVREEPLGGVSYAMGDVVLDNTTNRFTWGVSDTIGTALKPRRPCKIFMGLRVLSQDKNIPVLYGLTGNMIEDKVTSRYSFQVYDYLNYINEYVLGSQEIYTNQRADEIIADLLTTMGFNANQYSLDEGLNVIGYAWFDKGTRAGDAIRKLCEAEEGHFYQDEHGVLRFENRRHYLTSPHTTSQWTINAEDILMWEEDKTVPIINSCTVTAKPRSVQPTQEIWRDGIVEEVNKGEAKEIWANFENPSSDITAITATTDYIANTKSDGSGTDITSKVSISVDEFATSAKLTITNSYGGIAYLTLLRLRGTPAVVTSEIEQTYSDADSIEDYGTKELKIDNDFIDDDSFAYYMARAIVRKYKSQLRRIRITVPGLPQLQISDKVYVEDRDTATKAYYRVMKIRTRMSPGQFLQTLTLREITAEEADTPAIVGTSTVDSSDVVWI